MSRWHYEFIKGRERGHQWRVGNADDDVVTDFATEAEAKRFVQNHNAVTREPFIAEIVVVLTALISRTGEIPTSSMLIESLVGSMPDATIGEVKEAVRRYMWSIAGNDNEPHPGETDDETEIRASILR